jgi:hypothetical protein
MERIDSLSEKEREVFYRQQIERLTPPATEHEAALLRAYKGLLEAVSDAVGDVELDS